MMKKIQVEHIENGQCLAREVCAASGNTLLTKGQTLTPWMARRLKNWGISYVYIEGEQESKTEHNPHSLSAPNEIKAELLDIFNGTLNNPIMKTIFAAAYQYRQGKKNNEY
ncbi:hypothetical protein QA601_04650 [Chitinispirillales bacterium ANBcel5]|uniref:hypothetical protein n=1 Tax=Cellulosispirillum alkaliphilum TaxID=3039283 RepID=UPI002A57BB62|nr:hypothetical protein [Chitinispirillales bacterium ANBcel5]